MRSVDAENAEGARLVTLNFPWWSIILLTGVVYWPVTLLLALVSSASAFATRGIARGVAALSAVAFSGVLVLAGALGLRHTKGEREARAEYAATNRTIDAPLVIDGLSLPAGAEVEWTGVDRMHLRMAGSPRPTRLLGVTVDWIARRDDQTGWDVQLSRPQIIEGWPCDKVGVHLSSAGRLRGCKLAAGRLWRGWPIPAGVPLDLTREGEVEIALTEGAISAPEIGRAIPATGGLSFNADGSLNHVYFSEDDPLVVHGARLWNTVTWVYPPTSFGQGRRRRAVAMRGVSLPPEDRNVEVRPADGGVLPVD